MKPACSSIWSSVIPICNRSWSTACTAGSARSMPLALAGLLCPGLGRAEALLSRCELISTPRGGIMLCAGGCCEADECLWLENKPPNLP